ncbi:hypothetical protein DL766_001954 [Monosporascus sp. MC13-8B]|uniref:Transcription factor domain-containing protein n=1 Tax=Monosporascus cannonballus TaxID=155416 RepID=A0ABY0GZB2_9PEZI|nr:hypothetical protein DL762_007422 [Monosporascus cannonballus]RYO97860.1 hypothetical protein DL763_002528 [Monosporascus cannonballus]RYP36497.1 hypothetical protein DL766_001954 [Monosporascus sp. MC13-8B]
MVKFVGSDSAGFPLKPANDKESQPRTDRHLQTASSNGKSPSTAPATQTDITNTAGRVSRFVGDMNPECMFIEVTSPYSSRDHSIRGGVGVWQSRVPDKPCSASSATGQESTSGRTTQGILKPHVQVSYLPCRPPASDFVALRRIYVEKLDPLFPAISLHLARPPEDEIAWIVLQQVVSLAAASEPEAVPHLRLQNREGLLGRNEFSAALSTAIRTTIDAGFITDRVIETRILLVFSLYMQPTCPEEADQPARAFTDAVHQMHTLGLHLAADRDRDDFISTRSLFCCLWALDRITSSLYGRALLIHERDIGWDLDACIEAQSAPFRLFLMVVRLLDKVIDLYRPKNLLIQEVKVIELPIFEQMIIDAGATKVPSAFLGGIFWTAKVMASMAEQVLQEMDKAVASLTSQESQTADPSRNAGIPTGDGVGPTVAVPEEPTRQPHERGNVDPSFLGAAPDLDVFGHLDPTFDLDAVDAALEGNLDFGASSNCCFSWTRTSQNPGYFSSFSPPSTEHSELFFGVLVLWAVGAALFPPPSPRDELHCLLREMGAAVLPNPDPEDRPPLYDADIPPPPYDSPRYTA